GGKGVAVVDVTNPALPVHVTTCGTPSVPGPSDLVVAGGYAYVADAESGMVVVDLLPPYTMLARRQSPSLGEKLAVVKQSDGSAIGYVASRSNGLQVVQVSDAEEAENPAFIRSKLGLGDVTDVAVQDAYGYVADAGGRLYIVGLTNATNPSAVGSALTSGSARGVAGTTISSGKYALVADGSKGLSVVSTQVVSNPFEKATFDTPGWCSDVVPTVLGGDPFACVADGESGMRLINLSSIGTPDVTVFSDNFEDGIEGWSTGGTVEWYTGTPRRGTHSVRLRNDGSIQQTISTVGYSKIWVSYYLAAALSTTGSAVTAEWFNGSSWTLLKQIQPDDADEDSVLHPFTHELTTAADNNSSLALRFKLTGSASGDYGYVDDVIVRSSSSSDPYEVGFCNTPGQARGVAVSGDYAYVADGDWGLRVIDISAPGEPVEVGSYDTSGYAESVEVLGRVAVVADGSGGVVLVDCNTPTSPVELATYETTGWATDVDVVQGHAYVVENGWGLTVLRLWYTFRDVLFSNWSFREVEAAVANEITKGYPDGLYHPEIICSRDQMAAFIARALAGGDDLVPDPDPGTQTFLDIDSEHWAYKYIEYCYAQGIVQGYVDSRTGAVNYRPGFTVTRDVMAVFMARANGWVIIGEPMNTAGDLFPDVWAGYWAGTAIQACITNGVVKGYDDGYYRPTTAVTRDQMAVFIYRAFDL
ncbi:MAG: S-layer homology domain-containing protein, partial [Armatimonadota bacterium]|nr:S-layer homology domain-containing protein [Armatimonadota bacterium]